MDDDDEECWEDEEIPMMHGAAEVYGEPMSQNEPAPDGFYVNGRTVHLFENGVQLFQSSDPALVRHLKAMLGAVDDIRHEVLQELRDVAEEALFGGRIPNFSERQTYERHLALIDGMIRGDEQSDGRGY